MVAEQMSKRNEPRMKERSGVDGGAQRSGLLNLVQVMGNRLEVMGNPIPITPHLSPLTLKEF
jgi:hypothetical protein